MVLSQVAGALALAGDVERALKVADRIQGEIERAYLLAEVAEALASAGDVERALEVSSRALEVVDSIEHESVRILMLAIMLPGVAGALASAGDVEGALEVSSRALEAVERIGYERTPISVLSQVAGALALAGDVERALKVADRIRDEINRIMVLSEVARALALAGDVERALKVSSRALEIADRIQLFANIIQNEIFRILFSVRIAEPLALAGDVERALKVLNRALWVIENIIGYEKVPASLLANIARALASVGDVERALKVLSRALEIVDKLQNESERTEVLLQIAEAMSRLVSVELDVNIVKGVLVEGEDLEVEIRSNLRVYNVVVEFYGVKAQPVRLGRLEKGVTRVKVKPEFEPGRKLVTLSVSYICVGRRFKTSRKFSIEFKPRETVKRDTEVAVSGRVFGKYRILNLVGSGAFADVYRAVNENGEVVALKIYRGTDKAFIDEIGSFVQLTKRLRGIPYIVKPLDYGVSPAPYVAMELYPGTLRGLIGKNVEFKKKIKLLLRIAWVLSLAHSQGVYHGDLKPENILIKEEGGEYYPAIADWGGGFTPCYSAPEVYESEGKQVTDKSDVWSFGVIMYELLTDTRLFRDPFDYVERISGDIRVDFSVDELKDLINSCLLRDPAKRPPMIYVCDCLEKYLTNYLQSSISKKITVDTAVDLINMYLMRGDFEGARRGLRVSESGGIVPASILVLLEKLLRIYEVIYEYHGRVIPTARVEVAWRNMLDYLDKDLRDKLAKDEYSLEMYLALKDGIPSELHNGLRMSLERAVNIIISHYLSKQAITQ